MVIENMEVSTSARNDATLFVSVGSLFASPFFLEEPGELSRAFFTENECLPFEVASPGLYA